MFIIVEFLQDETVAVVPKEWLKNNMCPFSTNSKCRSLIKNNKPPMESYQHFEARRVGTFQSSDYLKAQGALKKSCLTSNIDSNDDDKPKYRSKKKPQRFCDSDSDSSSISSASTPKSIKMPDFPRHDNEKDCNTIQSQTNSSNISGRSVFETPSVKEIGISAKLTKNTKSIVSARSMCQTPTNETITASQCSLDEFKQMFLKREDELNAKIDWLSKQVSALAKVVSNMKIDDVVPEDCFTFPMQNIDDFDKFETETQDTVFMTQVQNQLRKVGGGTPAELTRKLWRHTMLTDLQRLFNFTGINNTKNLSKSNVNAAVQGAVLRQFPPTTLKEIDKATKIFFPKYSKSYNF